MNTEKKLMVHVCKSSWGIGTYLYFDNGKLEMGYGLYNPENPHWFAPDTSSCSREEIERWKRACRKYEKGF